MWKGIGPHCLTTNAVSFLTTILKGDTMRNVSNTFWKKWYGPDEPDRVALVRTLALPTRKLNGELYEHHCAVLINSYLSDLSEYLEGQEEQ